jgi:serine/threonine-protein kinase
MKDPKNLEIVQCLAETGFYRLLLFCTEEPQSCAQVMTVTLSPEECQSLRGWIKQSQTLQPTARPIDSRPLLKSKFETLKSEFPDKLDYNNLPLAMAL